MREKIAQYLKIESWDFLFGVIITLSLVRLVYYGLMQRPVQGQNQLPLTILLICVIYAGLIILGFWKWGRIIYSAAATVLAILFIVRIFAHNADPLYDQLEKLHVLAVILAAVLVFLAARNRVGTVILLIVGYVLILGTYQIINAKANNPDRVLFIGWLIVFSVAILLLYLFRTYNVTFPKVKNDVLFPAGFMRQVLVMALTAFIVAVCIFIPLQKSVHEQTFTNQQIEMMQSPLNPNQSEPEDGGQSGADAGESAGDQTGAEIKDDETENAGVGDVKNKSLLEIFLKALPYLIIAGIAICILVLILTIGLRILWGKKIGRLKKEDAAVNYYHAFLTILAKGGYQKKAGTSLRDYSTELDKEVTIFAKTGCAFSTLTETYERIVYGHEKITNEEFMRFSEFYKNIFRSIRIDKKEHKTS